MMPAIGSRMGLTSLFRIGVPHWEKHTQELRR